MRSPRFRVARAVVDGYAGACLAPSVLMARADVRHGTVETGAGIRLHYLEAGDGAHTALLVHGFPQTSHEWRKVIPPLVEAGHRVVAPDYRGAGNSSRPASGYDKR